MQKIIPCLWFDQSAEEAAEFYTSLFPNSSVEAPVKYSKAGAQVSGQKEGSTMTVEFEIMRYKLLALNGGPLYQFSPATSLFVSLSNTSELEKIWNFLQVGGKVRMPFDQYPWSQRYGWVSDKFGLDWQLIFDETRNNVCPALLFVDKLFGQGEQALNLYQSIFPQAKISLLSRDEKSQTILHARLNLGEDDLVISEGPGTHNFTFSSAFSLMINCETQDEIDHYWEKLSDHGGKPGPCGWLEDLWGVSWQVVPRQMSELMKNPSQAEKVMEVILKMQKLNLAEILSAQSAR